MFYEFKVCFSGWVKVKRKKKNFLERERNQKLNGDTETREKCVQCCQDGRAAFGLEIKNCQWTTKGEC